MKRSHLTQYICTIIGLVAIMSSATQAQDRGQQLQFRSNKGRAGVIRHSDSPIVSKRGRGDHSGQDCQDYVEMERGRLIIRKRDCDGHRDGGPKLSRLPYFKDNDSRNGNVGFIGGHGPRKGLKPRPLPPILGRDPGDSKRHFPGIRDGGGGGGEFFTGPGGRFKRPKPGQRPPVRIGPPLSKEPRKKFPRPIRKGGGDTARFVRIK